MAYSKSDLLTFDEVQLKAMIEIVEEVRDKMVVSKNSFDDYIAEQLKPNWTTEGGLNTVSSLENFSNSNIQSFIEYINARIQDLYSTLDSVQKINIA